MASNNLENNGIIFESLDSKFDDKKNESSVLTQEELYNLLAALSPGEMGEVKEKDDKMRVLSQDEIDKLIIKLNEMKKSLNRQSDERLTNEEVDNLLYDLTYGSLDTDLDTLKLNTGDVVFAKVEDIGVIRIANQKEFKIDSFQHSFILEYDNQTSLNVKNKYTLLRYIGDGIFLEYYTKYLINIFNEEKVNCHNFMKIYNSIETNNNGVPFGILASNLIKCNDNSIIEQIIGYSSDVENCEIANIYLVNNLSAKNINSLKKDFNMMYGLDTTFALEENRIIDFIKPKELSKK